MAKQLKKKLIFITWDYVSNDHEALVGGMVKNPYYLYQNISSNAYNKVCITTSKNKDYKNSFEENVIQINTNYLGGILKFFIRSYLIGRQVKQHVDEETIIHAHTPAMVPLNCLGKCKLVVTGHGTHWPEFKANFRSKNIKDWILLLNAFIQFNIEKKIYQACDKVISVSEFQVKELVDDYCVPRDKIAIIQNGIDIKKYNVGYNKDKKYDIIFVGRPVPKKGINILLSAIEKINESLQVPLTVAWVFGCGWVSEPNVIEKYKMKIESLGGDIYIDYPENQLPTLLSSSKMLVAPSLGYESIPTVILEAHSAGILAVASDSFGNREILPDWAVFPEGNDSALSEVILKLLANYDEYLELSKKIDFSKFTINRCVNDHTNLYQDCLQ